jgi:hypothetical protein
MLTVKQQYVKPLEIIWSKCSNFGWGPHNTIHVDDLERNFELNKQCGVLISPFHLKPCVTHSVGSDGMSALDGTLMNGGGHQRSPSNGLIGVGVGVGSNHGGDFPNGVMDNLGLSLDSIRLVSSATDGRSNSADSTKSLPISQGFEDMELLLLARYLVYIAVTVSDFSAVDHSLWRTRALEMPPDR